MLGKQNHTGQFSLYQTRLDTHAKDVTGLVSMNHPLLILATELDWAAIVQRTPLEKVASAAILAIPVVLQYP